ncbi:MAG: M23 family metallopeptidase [Anaerolineales bacterium]
MRRLLLNFLVLWVGLFQVGCSSASASIPLNQPTATPTISATSIPLTVSSHNIQHTNKPNPTITPTPMVIFPAATCQQSICTYSVHFPLQRPISPLGNLKVETSYRYGSTQNGQREVHHGVEFVNKAGIPVLAAADGKVVFAGNDDQQAFAMKRNFYGKLIILQHSLPGVEEPIYTVYGHLLKIQVENGQVVHSGEQIGEVGLGGVAAGTHLHFEVRYGKNDYDSTRNPELWFAPLLPTNGILIGIFVDQQHKPISIDNFVLESLTKNAISKNAKTYYTTYEDITMVGLQPWQESFGINDLSSGKYLLSFIYQHPVQLEFEILPAKVTFLNIVVR